MRKTIQEYSSSSESGDSGKLLSEIWMEMYQKINDINGTNINSI